MLTRLCVFLLSLFIAQLAYAQSAGDALQQKMAAIKTLQAQFDETVISERGKTMQQAKGQLTLDRPGKFRWQTFMPNPQLIIADGKQLWIYDEDLQQVSVKAQQQGLQATPALLLSSTESAISKHYDVSYQKQTQTFLLTPKDKNSPFSRIELQFANNKLVAMQLYDQLGQHTVLNFSNIKLNQPLAASTFQFVPPKGVDVIRN